MEFCKRHGLAVKNKGLLFPEPLGFHCEIHCASQEEGASSKGQWLFFARGMVVLLRNKRSLARVMGVSSGHTSSLSKGSVEQ